PVSDVDLATTLSPDTVVSRLETAGLKAVPTGIAHGTVTAVSGDIVAEVTTLRRDVETDGRHAEVAYTDDWRTDAERRDFTMNALYASLPDGDVIDFVGGLPDLAARRVRFIGDPLERIGEDHLRILRFFRFHARFGHGAPDSEGLLACEARANDLMALSRERIAAEVLKLLLVVNPVPTIREMINRAIFSPVLPEIELAGAARLQTLVEREARYDVTPSAIRRFSSLLPANPEVQTDVARRLRLSKPQTKRIGIAAERDAPLPDDVRALAWNIGGEGAVDRLLLSDIDENLLDDRLSALRKWTVPKLPISGRHLIARGLEPGPIVSATLDRFTQLWVEAGFPSERGKVEALADRAVHDAN
ncbi:MAG: CCA tRNA nucleotidyltransferase, partial [Pacificimonas sp.]